MSWRITSHVLCVTWQKKSSSSTWQASNILIARSAVASGCSSSSVKSKTIQASGIELTAELRTKNASTGFVNLISRLPGVENATLVSYNGEYLS